MFDELSRAGQAGDADRAARIFTDLKDRYGRTAFAEQGGLLNARVQADAGQVDAAKAALEWVGANATEVEYQTVAHLRLAGLLLDAKQYDEALKQLQAATAPGFEALVDDRRGDVLVAQGKPDDAKAAYQKSWQTMDAKLDYRKLVESKLVSLGSPPAADASKSASAGDPK
jgi:predicted negative regulator of RcsB-dependent stress response